MQLLSSPDGCLRSGRVRYVVILRCWLLAGHKLCEKNLVHYATHFSQMLFCGVRNVLNYFQAARIKRIEHHISTNYFKNLSTFPLCFPLGRLSCSCGGWNISQ